MPKRKGYLYERMENPELLYAALNNVLKGKKWPLTTLTEYVRDHQSETIAEYLEMIQSHSFVPAKPRSFTIEEGVSHKTRLIQAPKPYPDQVMHWAVVLAMDEIFNRGMYRWSCGSIPGRGQIDAVRYVEKKLRSHRGETKYKYCLKMDIHHFFQSIDHDILLRDIKRKIKDPKMIRILRMIIESVQDGLPIGYYTSQWLANFYLEKLDHFIKEQLHVGMYVRYVDDLVICDSKKRRLHQLRNNIESFLRNDRKLLLKGNWQVFKIKPRGIDFCGFRMFHDRTGIRKAILSKIRAANKRVQHATDRHAIMSMLSYYGYFDHSDTYMYRKNNGIASKEELVIRLKRLDASGFDNERDMYADYHRQCKENHVEWISQEGTEAEDASILAVSESFGDDRWNDMMDTVIRDYGDDPNQDNVVIFDLDHLEDDEFECGSFTNYFLAESGDGALFAMPKYV